MVSHAFSAPVRDLYQHPASFSVLSCCFCNSIYSTATLKASVSNVYCPPVQAIASIGDEINFSWKFLIRYGSYCLKVHLFCFIFLKLTVERCRYPGKFGDKSSADVASSRERVEFCHLLRGSINCSNAPDVRNAISSLCGQITFPRYSISLVKKQYFFRLKFTLVFRRSVITLSEWCVAPKS